jgi:surfeit locus 1 family protein
VTVQSRRSLVVPAAAVGVTFAVLVSLGTWQLQRLSWKEALISRVEARVDAGAEPLPHPTTWPALDALAIEYQPVRLAGRFDHSREVHVFIALGQPRGPLGGQGYFVVTPLMLDEGQVVFVNRGFVPAAFKDPATREEGQVTGRVEIEGLMRPAEEATSISPDPDIAKNVWFVRNPAAMAAGVGIDPAIVAPFTVDARAGQSPGGLPQGGETVVAFSNNHLGYAITWYGLAAALIGVSVAFLRRWRTQSASGPGDR